MVLRGRLRNQVVFKALYGLSRSNLIMTFFFTTIFILLCISTNYWLLLAFPALWMFRYHRHMIFEIFVLGHIIENSLGIWEWYSQVDDDIYLGAIPMESMAHLSIIALDLNVQAVLSIVEEYEFYCGTLAGLPLNPSDWKRDDMSHLHLSSRDFLPPSFQVLDKGSEWINEQVINGKKVYCHCKSGIGRSASVVMAYFMRYKRMTAHYAYKELKQRRPYIFGEQSAQFRNMVAYETHCRKSDGT